MEKIVSEFLHFLKIPVSKKYVEKIIRAHPDFPSLLSISDVFQRLGVNHRVARIEKEQLIDLAFPYLIPLDKGNGDILLIKNANSLRQYKDRLPQWSGAVVLAETTAATTDNENNNLYAKESTVSKFTIAIMLALASLLLLSLVNSFTGHIAATLVLSLCGLTVGYLLFAKELGISYAAVDAFCNTGKNSNCDKVLKAEVTLLGINFSDAVLTYFLFQVSALGFSSFFHNSTQPILFTLAAVSFLTLPVVIYSFYYQYAVAKTWCKLCLIVDAILIVQSGILGYSIYAGKVTLVGLSPLMLITLALVALVIFSGVMLVKTSIEKYEKLSQLGGSGNKVKHTASVFISLLIKQRKINTQPFKPEILLGNPEAPIKIIMASNLYCNPCKKQHEIAAQLINMYPDKVNLTMRFVKSGKEEGSVGYVLGYWHQTIYGKDDESQKTMNLMHDWFELWDLQKFMKKYQVKPNETEGMKQAAQHYTWIEETIVRQTPTFFINGYAMPKEYTIEDLLAMVPSLADSFNKTENIEMTLQHV